MPHLEHSSTADTVLAVNAGSSSIKFTLFEATPGHARLFDGSISGIGTRASRFDVHGMAAFSRSFPIPDHVTAIEVLTEWLGEGKLEQRLIAIGHRIVYGGALFASTQLVTPALIDALYAESSYDSEHLPQERMLIERLGRMFPKATSIACFDSAFHGAMPQVASMLPIPRRFFDAGVTRRGFHGLSCAYVMRALRRVAGPHAADGRVVVAHLGAGCSMTAVAAGRSCDTSMGLTPAGGMMMANRSGDVDPGLAWRMLREHQMTPARFNHMVHHEAGMKGVSGMCGDLRVLLEKESGERHAAEAVAMFCYQARKQLCAMAGAMEGIDTLVFTGGIGEHLATVRERLCAGLAFLGIELDPERNAVHADVISTPASAVTVRVIPTDEQWEIAEEVATLLGTLAPTMKEGFVQ